VRLGGMELEVGRPSCRGGKTGFQDWVNILAQASNAWGNRPVSHAQIGLNSSGPRVRVGRFWARVGASCSVRAKTGAVVPLGGPLILRRSVIAFGVCCLDERRFAEVAAVTSAVPAGLGACQLLPPPQHQHVQRQSYLGAVKPVLAAVNTVFRISEHPKRVPLALIAHHGSLHAGYPARQ